jgi:hypothetical protein
VHPDQRPHQREPQPQAPLGAIEAGRRLGEEIEDRLEVLGRRSDSESNTTRLAFTRSISATSRCITSRSSTSEGSNRVFSASNENCGSAGCSSNIAMSSSDQPWDRATDRSSEGVSERLMYIPLSPRRRPSSRNCRPRVVVFPDRR